MANNEKKSLGYLGEDFQYKLVHAFMEEKEFFKDLSSIVDQNMFTNPHLKVVVGVMKEFYEREEAVPSYQVMGIVLNEKSHSETEREIYKGTLKKIKETTTEGNEYIKQLAIKFFKQQNIVKTANEILKIAGDGDTSRYEECVELLNKALNQGTHTEFGSTIFDDIGETLSDDYRTAIPTGIGKLDEALEGGLGKGEIGVMIGSSSFGKAQPLDSKILTPDGWKLMGEMKVGDYVIGRDGKPYMVSGVFPQGIRPIYKVTFVNGAYCECDIEHLWTVYKKYKNKPKTYTLKQILEKISDKNFKNNFYIPINDKINDNTYEERFSLYCQEMKKHSKISKNGKHVIYKTDNQEMFEKMKFIVNSFGISITYNKIIENNYFFKFSINSNDLIPFNVDDERYDKIVISNSPFFKRLKMTNIEYVGEKEAQCIMVDSEEHLYITDNFIVTHNTSMTTAIASHAATYKCEANNYSGYKVLQIVFEDRIKQIQRKHIGRITGIEAKDLSKPDKIEFVKEQIEKYEDKETLKQNLRIIKFPSGEYTASHIERFIKKLTNSGFKPDLVIVDYFECLNHIGDRTTTNEWEKEGKTMRKFESMAAELDIAFWIPTQGTRDSVNMELVTMDKAGGSFKKIQIAHIVVSIARTMEDIDANKATLALLKNRAGKAGKVFNNVEFNNGTCRISTDGVDEFDNMFEYNKNSQKEKIDLAARILQMANKKNK